MFAKSGIKTKLLAMSVAISFLSVFVGICGHYFSQKVQGEYKFVLRNSIPKTIHVNEMFLNYRQLRIQLRTLGLPGLSEQEAKAAIQGTLEAMAAYEKAEKAYVELGFIGKQEELYKKTAAAWADFKKTGAEVLELHKKGTPEAQARIIGIFLKDCPEKAATFSESILALNIFHREVMKARGEQAESYSEESDIFTLSIIVLGLIVGIVLGSAISSGVSNELRSIAGDLFGNANEVSSTASTLNSSSEALSSAAAQQAAAIQETVAAIEEIRAMVQRNSDHAKESSSLSGQSKTEANLGKQSIQSMITAVSEIGDSNHKIETEVENGNRRIGEIVNIIQEIEAKTKVINEIVFQTKLLSFNASVEAARAGDHGKGFAVVADEINNLATMSGNAATEISTLLTESSQRVESIVKQTTSSVHALMEKAREKVDHGGQVANQCGEILEKIVSNADRLSHMVESIASASQEQSAGVDEIAQAIQQLDEATHTNSNETHKTADSAAHLTDQVKSLNHSSYRLQVLIEGKTNSAGSMVNTFAWNERYRLGVDEMDAEHKILIERINALANAINDGASHAKLLERYRALSHYTKEHFADEEKFMHSIGYPDLKNHQTVHKTLLARVDDFEDQVALGTYDPAALMAFLNDWLVKHILGVDMKYANYTRSGHSTTHRKAS